MEQNATATLTATEPKAQASKLAVRALYILAVAAAYYLSAVIGTVLSVPPSGFAIIWPATAVLIGVMLIAPRRHWWTYLLGLIPAHLLLASQHQPHAPMFVLLTQIAGNVLVARLTVATLHAAMGPQVRFDQFRSVLTYILVAGVAAPAVGNALVLMVHVASGWTDDFWLSWRQWMLACVFPTLTIPPIISLARDQHLAGYQDDTLLRVRLEIALACVALFGLSCVVFSWQADHAWGATLLLAPLPLLIWAAVRLGVGGTCLALVAFGSALLICAMRSTGPFAENMTAINLLSLQVYMIVSAVPLILLAALVEEWRRTQTALQLSESRMGIAAASTDTGLWQWDETKQTLWMTAHCRRMFGWNETSHIDLPGFLALVHEEDRARVAAASQWMINSGDVNALHEFRVVRPDGETRWFAARTTTEFGKDRQLLRISGVMRDITPRKQSQIETEALTHRLLTLQEEERENIAMELHDSTTQHLVAAGLSLGMLKRRLAPEEATQKAVDDMTASLSHAINELRMFTYLLRPAGLGHDKLSNVARRYVEGFAQRGDLVARFKTDPGVDKLPIEHQRILLRIIQEGLMNVHRHAGAMRVSVVLKCVGGRLTLIIGDDGNGMLLRPVRKETEGTDLGLGVPGMRVRTLQLGGKMAIRSTPRATTVVIVIPCEPPPEAN